MTGIYELKDRAPYELSGGQQQRVAIASVLAMQPEIIVLDEPTSFLDPVGAQNIFEVINRLNKDLGITIILVEHRLDLTSKYASRVIIMDRGKIVLDGPPKEILNSEEAKLIGVGIPKVTRLYQVLKNKGVVLNCIPLSAEEATKDLLEVLRF
ncbi:MAG: ATP-binding cassette domain-containing protein, partial [Candidatus Bathyarchaeia archaeon]